AFAVGLVDVLRRRVRHGTGIDRGAGSVGRAAAEAGVVDEVASTDAAVGLDGSLVDDRAGGTLLHVARASADGDARADGQRRIAPVSSNQRVAGGAAQKDCTAPAERFAVGEVHI